MDVEEKNVQILDRNKAEKRFKKLLGWILAAIGVTLILFVVFPKNINESGLTTGKPFVMGENTFVYANAKRYSNQIYRLGFMSATISLTHWLRFVQRFAPEATKMVRSSHQVWLK